MPNSVQFGSKVNIWLTKSLLFSFLLLYSAPIFFYDLSVKNEITYFLIVAYILVILLFVLGTNSLKSNSFISTRPSNLKFSFYCAVIFLIYFIVWLKTRTNYVGFFNRSTRESEFLQGNLYVTLDIFLRILFCKLLIHRYNKIDYYRKSILLCLLTFSLFFDFVYLGARRTATFIILCLIWRFLPTFSRKQVLTAAIFFFSFGLFNFFLSGYRELIYSGYTEIGFNEIVAASFFTNEFQLVSENFMHYKGYADLYGYGYGISILQIPLVFIPRFFWYDKPQTLDKVTNIFPNLLGELFYNFSYLSIIFLIFYLFIIIWVIRQNRYYSIIVFALIPELFRTTISIFVFSLVLYILFFRLVSLRIRNSRPIANIS